MKKIFKYILIGAFIVLLSGCSSSTKDNASPENLYKENRSIDLLVYQDTAYVNAEFLDWVNELELESDEKLGSIMRTGVTKRFKDFDATILEIETEVYSVIGRDDIVFVLIDEKWIPYYAYVEG
ncbi:MAG: hypothetical protein ACYDEX_09415 [Mobilitalea sp.]